MMGKYDPLRDWLLRQEGSVELSFVEIDALVHGGLPDSARNYREWWANARSNPQARAWLGAGRSVEQLNLAAERVRFSSPARGATGEKVPFSPDFEAATPTGSMEEEERWSYGDEWYWEGNIQAALIEDLQTEGWVLERQADTARQEAGIDVLVSRDQQILAVEVKGYPADRYVRGSKQGTPKPTSPPTQARHWFAEAILTTLLTMGDHPQWQVAVAFPDFMTYRTLIDRTVVTLQRLGIGIYVVDSQSRVRSLVLPSRVC